MDFHFRWGKRMAFVRKRGGRWYIYFRDSSGKRKVLRCAARSPHEAEKLAWEKEALEERVALGLDEPLEPMTFSQLAVRYLSDIIPTLGDKVTPRGHVTKHLLPAFGEKLVHRILPADVQAFLTGKIETLSIRTREHLRMRLQTMLRYATKLNALRGRNAAKEVDKLEGPRRAPLYMPREYLPRIVEAARDPDLMAYALLTGVRKGELCGQRREDIFLRDRYIEVRHSYDGTTKTNHERQIPVPNELLPFIKRALSHAERLRSPWLFPRPDGKMRRKTWNAAKDFRAALIAAGLINGYELRCPKRQPASGTKSGRAKLNPEQVASIRTKSKAGIGPTQLAFEFGVSRRTIQKARDFESWSSFTAPVGCGYEETVSEKPRGSLCPRCKRPMLVKPIPKPFTMKHARSTWATWAYRITGDIHFVQKQLGHQDVSTTERYAHRIPEHAIQQVNRLRLVPQVSLRRAAQRKK